MAKTPYFTKAEAEAKNQETFRDIKQTVQAISAGEGGKIYDTLAQAQALEPKPIDGTIFSVRGSGYYSFQSAEPNGIKFERSFYDYNITPEKTTFFSKGNNLFDGNYKQIRIGIHTSSNKLTYQTVGDFGQRRTAVIKVDSGKTVSFQAFGDRNVDYVYFYAGVSYTPLQETSTEVDLDEVVLFNDPSINKAQYTNTQNHEVYLLIAVSITGQEPNLMVNYGSEYLPYEEYSPKIDSKYLPDFEAVTPTNDKFVAYEIEGLSEYFTPSIQEDLSGAGSRPAGLTSIQDFYDRWDALMAAAPTGYITKSTLTTSVPSDTGNLPIYAYEFHPDNFDVRDEMTVNSPKFIVSALCHGGERTGATSLLMLMEKMVNNWDSSPFLEFMRFNIPFVIIPAVNPSGWRTGDRRNYNGVDLNRNFPLGWRLVASSRNDYGGSDPLSEVESQAVDTYLQQYENNIFAGLDIHNFGTLQTTDGRGYYMSYCSTNTENKKMEQVLKQYTSLVSRKFKAKDSRILQDFDFQLAFATSDEGEGFLRDHYKKLGAPNAVLYETHQDWLYSPTTDERFDANNFDFAVEGLSNFFRYVMKYGIEIYNNNI